MPMIFVPLSLILGSMISIQYGASVAKQLFPLAGVAGTTALRVFISALILTFIARLWRHPLSKQRRPWIAAYGMCLGAMNMLFYFALERIPLGITVALEFIGPLSVALYSSRKPRDLMWVLLAALGIYLILPHEAATAPLNLGGVLMALGAGAFWGLYIVFGKRAGTEGSSMAVTAWGMWFATLVTLPLGLILNGPQMGTVALWPLGLAVALLSSAIPYSLEMKAMRRIPSKTFGVLLSLAPVIAVLMGWIFLKEKLEPIQWVAITLIVVASIGSTT